MELVLKTSDVARHRGFESLSLRHMEKYPRGRRGSPAKGVVCDKCSESSNLSFSAMKQLKNIATKTPDDVGGFAILQYFFQTGIQSVNLFTTLKP